jgi:hypothetical protein
VAFHSSSLSVVFTGLPPMLALMPGHLPHLLQILFHGNFVDIYIEYLITNFYFLLKFASTRIKTEAPTWTLAHLAALFIIEIR